VAAAVAVAVMRRNRVVMVMLRRPGPMAMLQRPIDGMLAGRQRLGIERQRRAGDGDGHGGEAEAYYQAALDRSLKAASGIPQP